MKRKKPSRGYKTQPVFQFYSSRPDDAMPNKQETWAEPIKVSKFWALRVGSRDPSQRKPCSPLFRFLILFPYK